MPTSTTLNSLKINKLTEAQYDTAVQQGVIGANDISFLIDADDPNIQVSTLPTASASELDNIYQYVGTTGTYTNGYFYKCVSDGAASPTYSWTQVDVQPGGGGGSLPSQTGNAGKFLTTDGTDASWSDKPLVNNDTALLDGLTIGSTNTTSSAYNVCIGKGLMTVGGSSVNVGYSTKTSTRSIAIGADAEATSGSGLENHSIAIGLAAKTTAVGAIQLGGARTNIAATNADANTFKVANANGNYEIMSANGTIPTDRFTTTPSSDGNYVPTLSISSGTATRSWISIASSVSSSSTNAETVGAKLFYDTVGNIEAALQAINSGNGGNV